ncbi:MAG TPA: NAD-dependent deacylase [Bacteroidota bacterium]|nr:NAD-dependent deacylase [Bacteroidota bacterium]
MTGGPWSISAPLRAAIAGARRIVVFTGAGMSAESGVPTFRGPDGIWKKFKPEELASFSAFMKNPGLVWEWYEHRRVLMASVTPNPGHRAVADMEKHLPGVTVVTQNIDDLHRRAGSSAVIELHGNINRNYCTGCGKYAPEVPPAGPGKAPACPACGGLIRPDVVWFGEDLPEDEWNSAVAASRAADLFLAVGTSGVVFPAASLPEIAHKAGAYVAEINTGPGGFPGSADELIEGKAGEVLPAVAAYLASLHHNGTGI